MNSIRQIQALNKRELENNVSSEASWHTDYRDTAWVYIGGLPFDLSEGDIVTIFSQYGEPVHINLVRDKETGKSRGFAFLKYEDQRSTDLAVDNLSGASVMGRLLNVDHTRYKKKDEEEVENNLRVATAGQDGDVSGDEERGGKRSRRRSRSASEEQRPMLKEEKELVELMRDHDNEDPMKEYLIEEKKEQVANALANLKKPSHRHRDGEKSHRHRRRSRDSRRHREEGKLRSRSASEERLRRKHRERHGSRSQESKRRRADDERSRSRERRDHKGHYDGRR